MPLSERHNRNSLYNNTIFSSERCDFCYVLLLTLIRASIYVYIYIYVCVCVFMWDRNSSVGIANCYRVKGQGIETRWARDFPHPSSPTLGHTQPPIQWVQGLSRRQQRGHGVALTTHSFQRRS